MGAHTEQKCRILLFDDDFDQSQHGAPKPKLVHVDVQIIWWVSRLCRLLCKEQREQIYENDLLFTAAHLSRRWSGEEEEKEEDDALGYFPTLGSLFFISSSIKADADLVIQSHSLFSSPCFFVLPPVFIFSSRFSPHPVSSSVFHLCSLLPFLRLFLCSPYHVPISTPLLSYPRLLPILLPLHISSLLHFLALPFPLFFTRISSGLSSFLSLAFPPSSPCLSPFLSSTHVSVPLVIFLCLSFLSSHSHFYPSLTLHLHLSPSFLNFFHFVLFCPSDGRSASASRFQRGKQEEESLEFHLIFTHSQLAASISLHIT